MKCQKYIARCYRVYQHERNESASFLSIFKGGGRPKWRFSNFPRFWKNSSALGSFNCIFENKSLKALFGQNMKKVKILKLSPDSRYLQKLALKAFRKTKLSNLNMLRVVECTTTDFIAWFFVQFKRLFDHMFVWLRRVHMWRREDLWWFLNIWCVFWGNYPSSPTPREDEPLLPIP